MRICHASDLHGAYKHLSAVEAPDLWVITGDFFPTYGRRERTGYKIVPELEAAYQVRWWCYKRDSVLRALRGRPVLWVAGNHDFVSLAAFLRTVGHPTWDVATGAVEYGGHRFGGFREIPYIEGEWAGEAVDFSGHIERVFGEDPSILVTHAPPAGVLDNGYGIPALTTALAYRQHRIGHHFFGHIHEATGMEERMGILFMNSSCCVQQIDI